MSGGMFGGLTLAALFAALAISGCLGEAPVGGSTSEQREPQTVTVVENKRIEISAGGWAQQPFELNRVARVDYSVEDRDNGSFDVCLIDRSEARYWEDGQRTRGWACHDDVNSYSDHATLNAGEYRLALRCENYFDDCIIVASLYLTG